MRLNGRHRAELQTVFDSVMPKIDAMVKRQIQGVKEATGKPPTVRIYTWTPLYR
jgi:hypothetical protein